MYKKRVANYWGETIIPAIALLFAWGVSSYAESDEQIHVVIIGDSTVSTYAAGSPKRGWGQMIPQFFDDKVTFDNRAIPGRSTKTFMEKGDWQAALETLKSGDYVLIQFGHNDSHDPSRPEATDARGDYQRNLKQYIDDTREKGAIPVLITPMHRRSFDDKGQLLSYQINGKGEKSGGLAPYAEVMKKVAVKKEVTCIDLFFLSGECMQDIGDEGCKALLAPGDRTHWNEKGAQVMAALVVRGLNDSDEPLKEHIKTDMLTHMK